MKFLKVYVFVLLVFCACCSKSKEDKNGSAEPGLVDSTEIVYDETGCLYTTYDKLVMAGYQGWFAAEGDASQRGWYHYENGSCGGFLPGCSTIDFWPDVSEYTKTYLTPFKFNDGTGAYLYSPYDAESVDLHFKWMKDYGIDGVFMQRFVVEIKNSNPKGKNHFNKVLENALAAAEKYGRAISIMYDLSGCNPGDVAYVEQDWNELIENFDLFNNHQHPTYLRHNGRPMLAIWGVGFNDNRKYTVADANTLIEKLKGPNNKVSILLGVPYYWRTFNNDTENNPGLHELIKKVDLVMPWAVGRYNNDNYLDVAGAALAADIQWCRDNKVGYVPLVFPGFSWGNLQANPNEYHSIPRLNGDFLWKQVAGAKLSGAQSLYVAMFDEIDEGTAIYKCLNDSKVPLNADKKFVGIEDGLPTDHYLWLTGEAAKWFHGLPGYNSTRPLR